MTTRAMTNSLTRSYGRVGNRCASGVVSRADAAAAVIAACPVRSAGRRIDRSRRSATHRSRCVATGRRHRVEGRDDTVPADQDHVQHDEHADDAAAAARRARAASARCRAR